MKIALVQVFPRSSRQCADDYGTLRATPVSLDFARSRLTLRAARVHLGSVFSRPCSRPKFSSRSREESPKQLPLAANHSSERAPRSRVRPRSGKLLEKLGDKIARHRSPISSGRANIVDRANLLHHALSCRIDQRWLDLFSGKSALRFIQAKRNGRNASQRETHIPNRTVRDLAQSGEANLGNRLRVAGPYLSRMRKIFGESARQ